MELWERGEKCEEMFVYIGLGWGRTEGGIRIEGKGKTVMSGVWGQWRCSSGMLKQRRTATSLLPAGECVEEWKDWCTPWLFFFFLRWGLWWLGEANYGVQVWVDECMIPPFMGQLKGKAMALIVCVSGFMRFNEGIIINP